MSSTSRHQLSRTALLAITVMAASKMASGCASATPGEPESAEGALAAAEAAAAPAPKIERVSMTGPGCPTSDGIGISGNRSTFRIAFDSFIAKVTDWSTKVDAECTVSVVLEAPDGVSYSPAGLALAITGEPTRNATVTTSAHWEGLAGEPTRTKHVFRASRNRSSKAILDDEELWSPCAGQRELRFTTNLQVADKDGPGHARIREMANLRFRARRCEDSGLEADGGSSAIPDGGPSDGHVPPAPPDPSTLTINSVDAFGAACTGDNKPVISLGNGNFEAKFNGLSAREGAISATCTLSVAVTPPPGHRVAIKSMMLDGFSQQSAASRGHAQVAYYFTGRIAPPIPESSFTYTGPATGDFRAEAKFDGILPVGRCGSESLELYLVVSQRSEQGVAARISIERLHSIEFALLPCR
jgi:hypothetical protein